MPVYYGQVYYDELAGFRYSFEYVPDDCPEYFGRRFDADTDVLFLGAHIDSDPVQFVHDARQWVLGDYAVMQ